MSLIPTQPFENSASPGLRSVFCYSPVFMGPTGFIMLSKVSPDEPFLVYQRKRPGEKDQAQTGELKFPSPTLGEGGGAGGQHDVWWRWHTLPPKVCLCSDSWNLALCVSFIWLFLSNIFNNKTVTCTVTRELPENSMRQSLYLRSLWEPLNLQLIGPKRGWASKTCGWSLKWDGLVEDSVLEPVWSTLPPGRQYQNWTELQDTSWYQNREEATR